MIVITVLSITSLDCELQIYILYQKKENVCIDGPLTIDVYTVDLHGNQYKDKTPFGIFNRGLTFSKALMNDDK